MPVGRGAVEITGLQSLLRDFGEETTAEMRSDATAAIGIVSRLGLGTPSGVGPVDSTSCPPP